MQTTSSNSLSHAALGVLIVLQVVMLCALFTQTVPHPPLAVAPFALGPFLGASIAVAVAAFLLGAANSRLGMGVTILAAILALISFGPQKWIDPAIAQIWPAVLLGEIAVGAIILSCVTRLRSA